MPFDQPHKQPGPSGRPYSSQDMANVLFFLRQAEIEQEMWAGILAGDAFESACRIIGVPPQEMREHIGLGYEEDKPGGDH